MSDPAVSSHTRPRTKPRTKFNDWVRGFTTIVGLGVLAYISLNPLGSVTESTQLVALGAMVSIVSDARSFLFRGRVEAPTDEA